MRTKVRRVQERGQIALLNAFAIIVLLGFAAVAIDGSMLYVQRRLAQNAADTASLAAVMAMTQGYSGTQMKYIAMEKAKKNGFDNTDAETAVVVNWPPDAPNAYAGNANYVQVFITGTVNAAFAHFVYDGPLQVTVEAVAHARRGEDFAPGYAIFATNLDQCQTLEFDGNPNTALTGGGSIFSNSICDCAAGGAGVMNGNGTLNVYNGGQIRLGGCWRDNGGSGTVFPLPVTGFPQQPIPDISPPDCSGLTDFGAVTVKTPQTLEPGLYDSIRFNANADATLNPGMYCIAGSGPGGLAFSTLGSARVSGDGVLLYFMEAAGGFTSSANSEVYLFASDFLVDPFEREWAGMLIYVHPNNKENFILSGTSNSTYSGSIYAPSAYCEAQGTSGTVALQTQIICDRVRLTGTGDLLVNYDMSKNYHLPDAVELTN